MERHLCSSGHRTRVERVYADRKRLARTARVLLLLLNPTTCATAEREIAWLKLARKEFKTFPLDVQLDMRTALTIAARGGKADTAKPFKGAGGGVLEIALKHRGDAFRVIYVVQIGAVLWVVDAFQKKSKRGIATPRADVDRIKQRIKQLRETYA